MAIRTLCVRGLIYKELLPALAALLLLLGVFALYVVQPYVGSENSDSEFGYYGQYNRVKHVIESTPNVRIVARWRHKDLTLEDFGFTLLRDGTHELQVNVYQDSPERKTRRKSRLRELIQRQIDANQRPETWQIGFFPDDFYDKSPELKAWRRTQPDPVIPKPVDPTQRMLVKRSLRPGESIPASIDANQPAPRESSTTGQPK